MLCDRTVDVEQYWLSGERDCIIISVQLYDNGQHRTNAWADAKRLQQTFAKLKFDCKVICGRVVLEDIEQVIISCLANGRQARKDMIAICLLAHGGANKQIMLSDGLQIRVSSLLHVTLSSPLLCTMAPSRIHLPFES